jgi:hypothetical protein
VPGDAKGTAGAHGADVAPLEALQRASVGGLG